MSLFKIIEDSTLKKVDRKEFTNERELQNLVERNLALVMLRGLPMIYILP